MRRFCIRTANVTLSHTFDKVFCYDIKVPISANYATLKVINLRNFTPLFSLSSIFVRAIHMHFKKKWLLIFNLFFKSY